MTTLSKTLLTILLACIWGNAEASKVDTVLTHSDVMGKDIKAVVILPDAYSALKKFPVVYLLHGYSGSYADWVTKNASVKTFADQYNCIIVCPDGAFASWYIDSPVSPTLKYDTYISKELVSYVDRHFSTIRDRKGRAITGLSMGGHGALYLAIKHQEIYGAVGSMSGGVDLKPFAKSFAIDQVLGKYENNAKSWGDHSVVGLMDQLQPGVLKIIFDCGTDDFFFGVNNALHEQMLKAKIPHDYTARPGAHTWSYWSNSLYYHMLYFSRFFEGEN
jgi:S-formylglutathione hydrolase FrmB